MNDSGRSVQPAAAFYKVPLDGLLVVHDEVDLDVGRLQAASAAASPATTAFAPSRTARLARVSAAACSASAARAVAIPETLPTSSCRRSHPRTISPPSSRALRTRSSRSSCRGSRKRSASSTDYDGGPSTGSRPGTAGPAPCRQPRCPTLWTKRDEPGTEPAHLRHASPATVPQGHGGAPGGGWGEAGRRPAAYRIGPRGACFPPFAWTRLLSTPSSRSSQHPSDSRRS